MSYTDKRIDALLSKNEQVLAARGNQNSNRNANGNKFKVSVFVGNKRKLTKNRFTINNSVRDLKREIAENEAGGNPSGCDVRLIFDSKPLADDKTLGECGIVNSSCFVTAVIRVVGGGNAGSTASSDCTTAAYISDEKKNINNKKNNNNNNKNNKSNINNNNNNKRKYKNLLDNGTNSDTRVRIAHFGENRNIKPTLEADCVTFEDSQNELRVKMPCGHVFSPLTIFKWCQRTLEVYSKSKVCCPILKCNKEWNVKDIVSGGDLDLHEHGSLVNILSHRKLMQSGDFKECEECKALIELPDTVYICRVRCTSEACKTKGDFCWLCGKSWKCGGMAVCGNEDCHSAYVNDLLKIENCGTTTEVMDRNDVECPKLRACPRCLSITEYKKDCKHMKCWNCKRSFCFICLSLAGKEVDGHGEEWACEGGDKHFGKCQLAPVQVLN